MDGHACQAYLCARSIEGYGLTLREAVLPVWIFLVVTIFLLGDVAVVYWLWKTGRIGKRPRRNWPDKEG